MLQPKKKRQRSLTEFSHFLPQKVDSMRSAYYSDLCSKFMIENTILKMEYAEVRVFSISDRVGCKLRQEIIFAYLESNLLFREVLKSHSSCFFVTEPDHLMPSGPAAIGHPYQSVF